MSNRLPIVSQVVGVRHDWRRIKAYNACSPGEKIYLVPDPQNEWDKNAIEVRDRSRKVLGYLPRDVAAYVARHFGDDWFYADGVILARGEDYNKKAPTWYTLTVKIETIQNPL